MPFEDRFVDNNGVRIHYETDDAPADALPLVLMHGMGMSTKDWHHAGYTAKLTDESRPGDPRRMRVDNRTMLITSWNRVLDALQTVAAEGGHSIIEQDIAQLRGLVKTVTSDDP